MRSADDLDAIRRTQMLINIVIHVNQNADYNIFFVRTLDQHAAAGGLVGFTRGFTPNKLSGAAINACFIQDSAASGQTLAHELGHFLLSPTPSFMLPDGHSRGRDELMRGSGGPTDLRIPRAQANFMNTSGFP
jgi:Zn-dependent peptidase ImmA (M78 family)